MHDNERFDGESPSAAPPQGGSTATGGGRAAARKKEKTQRRKSGRGRRVLTYVALGTGVVVVAAAGGGYLYVQQLNGNIRKGALHADPKASVAPPTANAKGQTPINILLIGSDGRDNPADCKLGGACDSGPPHADVEMLVHLSADRTNASVTSIPRDTVVDLADCQGHDDRHTLITDSLNYGGPGCVVDTWQKLTGVHVDHYMMVDFAGVVSMADAVGGVPVCTEENVDDYQVSYDAEGVRHEVGSHLLFPAGTRKIEGEQALEWLRTRHAWEDGTDIGRTHAQHLYLNSMVRQMKSVGTLTNVVALNKLAQSATTALQVDDGLGSTSALVSLALQFDKVPTARITTVTIPWHYGTPASPGAASPVLLTQPQADQVFAQIRNDVPFDKAAGTAATGPAGASPTATPSPTTGAVTDPGATAADRAAVRLTVQNAGGVTGRGRTMTDFLVSKGFDHSVLDSSQVPPALTRLSYPTADKAQAQAVAAALGLTGAALSPSATATHLTLRIGTDWAKGTDFARTLPKKKPGLPPQTDSQNAADATQCMSVNPAPYTAFRPGQSSYIYSWTGKAPKVPQP